MQQAVELIDADKMQDYFEHSVLQDSVRRQRTINRFYNILNGPPPQTKNSRAPTVDPFMS